MQCSWMHKQSFSPFLPSHSSPLHSFSHPPCLLPMCLTCTPLLTVFLSTPPGFISHLFPSPLSHYLPHLMPLPSLTFLSSTGLQTAERLSTKASYSSPHTAPSITPTGHSPDTVQSHMHTHAHTHIYTLKNWCTHTTNKQVNNLLPENSVQILN